MAHKWLFHNSDYERCGKIRTRGGIVGGSVETDLANVMIQLSDNRECSVQVLCAIGIEVNGDLNLTKDVVDQLFHLYNLDVVSRLSVIKNMNDAQANDVNSERVLIDNADREHKNVANQDSSNINVTSSMLNIWLKPSVIRGFYPYSGQAR